jgi:hypothetical protein
MQQVCKFLCDVMEVGFRKLSQKELCQVAPLAAVGEGLTDAENDCAVVPEVCTAAQAGTVIV